MQAKRIQMSQGLTLSAGQFLSVNLEVPLVPREEVNFHNIWAGFECKPTTAGANSAGTWVLYIVKEGGSEIGFSLATVNSELNNYFIIACGLWNASNETPYSKEIHPTTSRTLNPGDKLALSVTIIETTAGDNDLRNILCAHTTRK